ncbi:lipoprotein, partial [Enterococcus faecalis]
MLRLYKLGDDKMKKAASIVLMVVAIFMISACGSKLDK